MAVVDVVVPRRGTRADGAGGGGGAAIVEGAESGAEGRLRVGLRGGGEGDGAVRYGARVERQGACGEGGGVAARG